MQVDVRAVLYTDDMEPITVLELPVWAREYLEKNRMVRLSVISPRLMARPGPPPLLEPARVVTIRAEHLVRNGRGHLMLFTSDDENALLLRSAFLPGQRGAVKEQRAEAFARGFLEAIHRLGRLE